MVASSVSILWFTIDNDVHMTSWPSQSANHTISELNFQFWFTVWIWVPGFSAMHWLGNLNIAELGYHCCCYKLKDIVEQTRGSLPKNLDVHLDS